MERTTLGIKGPEVTVLGLGCMYFGWREPEKNSLERLDQYIKAGGNFLDTANIYAEHWLPDKDYFGKDKAQFRDGGSERLMGQWLKGRSDREHLVIASKVGFPYPDVEAGTSAYRIRSECEKSLKRLGVDYLDLYYLHNDDRNTPLQESLAALNQLVREGLVKSIGASNFQSWRLAQAIALSRQNGWAEYCCVQQRYSYLRGKPGADFGAQLEATPDLMDFCESERVTPIAYSPLLGGAYTDPKKSFSAQYQGSDSDARLLAMDKVAQAHGATRNQVVYAWMLQSKPQVLPLVASSTAEQFREALGALELKLTDDEMAALNAAGA